MDGRKISLIGIILAFALFSAAVLLLPACRAQVLPLPEESSGFFDVDLILIGSEEGTPYIKEVHFTDSAQTVTVNVSYMLTAIDLELNTELSGAALKVNGYSLDYGNKVTVELKTGTNSVSIKVSPNLIDPFYYTLVIKQGVAPGTILSNDATLRGLTLDVPNVLLHPDFSSDIFSYDTTVNTNVSEITIIPLSSDENAAITINNIEIESGKYSAPVSLAYGSNDAFVIVVTAEDEYTINTYTIEIFRAYEEDLAPPTISLIGGSIIVREVYSVWLEPGYTAHDVVEGDLTSAVKISGSIETSILGNQALSYGVSDTSGNIGLAQRTVKILDTTAPVITLNGLDPLRVDLGKIFTDPGVEVTDNYDTGLGYTISGSVNTSLLGTYRLTYTAADSSGNSNSEIRNVVVSNDNDTDPPEITLIGDNPYTHEVNTAWIDPGYTASDAFDGNLTDSVAVSENINTSALGTTIIYYNVSDSSGNAAEQKSRAVAVKDSTPPEIYRIGAGEITVAHGSFWDDPGVTVSDNFDTEIIPSIIGSVIMNTVGIYPLLYRAYDSEGNGPAEVSRIVRVTDQTPPNFTLSGNSSIAIPLGGTFTEPLSSGELFAYDNVDGDLSSQIVVSDSSDNVNTEVTGTYNIYYDVSDSAGHAADTFTYTVSVVDRTPPVISLGGISSINIEFGSTFIDEPVTAADNYDGDLTGSILVSGDTVNTSIVSSYIIYYDVVDSSGNAAVQQNRIVIIEPPPDTIAPDIILNGPATISVEYPEVYIDQGAIATDLHNEDPRIWNITHLIVITDTVDYATAGSYTIDYDVTDESGNAAATVTRTVNVQDTTSPIIIVNGDNPLTTDYGSSFIAPEASAEDLYDGHLTSDDFIINGVSGVDTSDIDGSYEVSYSITDSNGNESTAVLIVIVDDISGPVITISGENPLTVECGEDYNDAGATAHDNYDEDSVINSLITSTGQPSRTSIPGVYIIEYDIAADSSGNEAETVSRVVNVVDTTPPVILLSGGTVTVEVGSEWVFQDPGYIITDNDIRTLQLQVELSDLNMNIAESQTLTYSLTDPSGNKAIPVTRLVNVIDTQPPIIDLGGVTSLEVDYGSVFTDSPVTASDNYDGDITGNISISGDSIDTFNIAEYILYYDVTDYSGNAAVRQSREISVLDLSAPEITLIGENPVTIECLTNYTDAGATALDNHDGDLTAGITTSGLPINTSTPGIHTVTYQATDNAEHSTEITRIVNIVDLTAPIIELYAPAALMVEVNTLWSEHEPGFEATDNVDGVITADVITSLVDMGGLGQQTIYYNVTDSSNNAADTVRRTLNVVDTTPPVISLIGGAAGTGAIIINLGDKFTDPGANVIDNFDSDRIIYGNSNVIEDLIGEYSLIYNTSDNHSNIAEEVTRKVTVIDPGIP